MNTINPAEDLNINESLYTIGEKQQESCISSIVSDESIFTIEEAMACFCVGAAIVKHDDMPLIPPGIFMFSDSEEFLIYKDLMMYAVYLLGIKSESNWTQIYAEAEDSDRLTASLTQLSQLSDKKKTCASVFLRTIAGSDADEKDLGRRLVKYHNYCIDCGIGEIFQVGIAQRLSMKMTIYNGYDYMWESYAEYLDEDELEDTFEDDEEFDPEYNFGEVYDEGDIDDDEDFEDDEDESEELDAYDFIQLGDEQFESGEFNFSKISYQLAMDKEPLYAFYCYYRIGWIEELTGNYEEALNCYDKGMAAKDDYAYLYLKKGDVLKKHLNRKNEADIYYRKCIELEEGKIEVGICWHHACAELGLRNKAVETMNRMLEEFPDEAGQYFDAACMYCTLHEYDHALEYLETCLNMGYGVQHVLFDTDLDTIRDLERYKEIISKYIEE